MANAVYVYPSLNRRILYSIDKLMERQIGGSYCSNVKTSLLAVVSSSF